jgi:hypothetical protein
MTNDEVETLLTRLKELQLEQQHIVTLLEEAYRNKTSNVAQVSPRSTVSTNSNSSNKKQPVRGFGIGDRVRITNKVRKQGDQPVGPKDRVGIVTSVNINNGRIYICTDNGTETWRLSHNLKHIPSHE